MTKNVGSMTRGQGHEICNQIDNTCKKYGVNSEEIVSDLIRENLFSLKVEEYILSKKEETPKTFIPLKPQTSNGRTGEQFLADLKKANLSVGSYAEKILKTKEFANSVTTGVTYHPGIIKGEDFSDSERTTENIRKEALKRGGITPPAELSPILRLSVTDEEIKAMDLLWLIPMHEPINDSGGRPFVLGLRARDFDNQLLAYGGEPTRRWDCKAGFVFLFPQVSTEILES